jgi:hypothetical protein
MAAAYRMTGKWYRRKCSRGRDGRGVEFIVPVGTEKYLACQQQLALIMASRYTALGGNASRKGLSSKYDPAEIIELFISVIGIKK